MQEFIKFLCHWKNTLSPVDVITISLSIATLICTIIIPVRIMKFQQYSNLNTVYMNHEFGYAFQNVIEFFHDDCGCDVDRIPEEYMKRYHSDFKKLRNVRVR